MAGSAAQTGIPPHVTKLVGPELPRDLGLTGLGLLMQLGGSLSLAAATAVSCAAILRPDLIPGAFALLAISSVARALFHRAAGDALVHGASAGRLRAIGRYIGMAYGQTAALALLLAASGWLSAAELTRLTLLLAAWPTALLVVFTRRRIRRAVARGVPVGEDLGFQGAAVLMLALGATAALVWLTVAAWLVVRPELLFAGRHGLLALLLATVMLGRALAQVVVGARGAGDPDYYRANDDARAWQRWSLGAAAIAAAASFAVNTAAVGFAGGLLTATAVFALLAAWPGVVRRFFAERNFAVYMSSGGLAWTRLAHAPDRGLTSLAWLMLGTATVALADTVGAALTAVTPGELLASVALAALATALGCAGRELVRMSPRAPLALAMLALLVVACSGLAIDTAGAVTDGSASERALAALRAGWLAVAAVCAALAPLLWRSRPGLRAVARPRGSRL